jgi:hypothetical protein
MAPALSRRHRGQLFQATIRVGAVRLAIPILAKALGVTGRDIMKPLKFLTGIVAFAVGAAALVTGLFLAICLIYIWELHPWVPAGQNIHISDQHLSGYDCQVWQLKNTSIVEPFTTGLFIRKQGEQWHGFWIGFEDSYHPQIRLQQEGSQLVVIFDGKNIGAIEEDLSGFKRKSDGSLFPPAAIKGEPPGNWWRKSETEASNP